MSVSIPGHDTVSRMSEQRKTVDSFPDCRSISTEARSWKDVLIQFASTVVSSKTSTVVMLLIHHGTKMAESI